MRRGPGGRPGAAAPCDAAGPRRRPRRLALLPAGEDRPRLSAPLNAVLAARLGALLAVASVEGEHLTEAGETYIGLVWARHSRSMLGYMQRDDGWDDNASAGLT
ncbi:MULTISPECIES: hypothetical protein [Streptomyces]|uniref:hypothetical protein n=1 Tax=Streptomyces TaxID=1883 RepID=UPI00093E16A5|nr:MULTISPECIES: hypothetical protein [Streptomyces]OKI51896.1 hypothetical protein AMK17_32250 [Streptomyces sp. CB00072]WTD30614.1 hypothetical protein OH737_39275 [Streptomyces anulatus]